MSAFRVEAHEQTTPLWRALRDHYEQKLAALRIQNDSRLNAEDTARLRGRIEEVKALLALSDPPRKPPPEL